MNESRKTAGVALCSQDVQKRLSCTGAGFRYLRGTRCTFAGKCAIPVLAADFERVSAAYLGREAVARPGLAMT